MFSKNALQEPCRGLSFAASELNSVHFSMNFLMYSSTHRCIYIDFYICLPLYLSHYSFTLRSSDLLCILFFRTFLLLLQTIYGKSVAFKLVESSLLFPAKILA